MDANLSWTVMMLAEGAGIFGFRLPDSNGVTAQKKIVVEVLHRYERGMLT
jgi:hypothetical protein